MEFSERFVSEKDQAQFMVDLLRHAVSYEVPCIRSAFNFADKFLPNTTTPNFRTNREHLDEDATWHLLLGKKMENTLHKIHFVTTERKIADSCSYFASILSNLSRAGRLQDPQRLDFGLGTIYVIDPTKSPIPISMVHMKDTLAAYQKNQT